MASEKAPAYPETINFDFVKSNDFRVEHADGSFIALTQTGVMISFYSERQPIPKRVVHRVTAEGAIGDEIQEQRVVRDAIVRDIQSAIIMNIDTAIKFSEILLQMIEKHKEVSGAAKK